MFSVALNMLSIRSSNRKWIDALSIHQESKRFFAFFGEGQITTKVVLIKRNLLHENHSDSRAFYTSRRSKGYKGTEWEDP